MSDQNTLGGFDEVLLATVTMVMGDLSTELKADFVRNLEFTLAVDKVLSSPKSWSRIVEKYSPGKLSSKNTARSLLLILRSGSEVVAWAS